MPIIPISGSAVARGALVPIASFTTTTITSDIYFNTVPQTYQDLRVVFHNRTGNPAMLGNVTMYANGTGASFWSQTAIAGDGATASSFRNTTSGPTFGALTFSSGLWSTPNVFSSTIYDVINYRGSGFKTVLTRSSVDLNGAGNTMAYANLFASTSPITMLQFSGTNLAVGTTVSIYGVRSVGQ